MHQGKHVSETHHGGWRHDMDPTGEGVTDRLSQQGTLKQMSGLRPMRVDRLLSLARQGVALNPSEQRLVDEYRQQLA